MNRREKRERTKKKGKSELWIYLIRFRFIHNIDFIYIFHVDCSRISLICFNHMLFNWRIRTTHDWIMWRNWKRLDAPSTPHLNTPLRIRVTVPSFASFLSTSLNGVKKYYPSAGDYVLGNGTSFCRTFNSVRKEKEKCNLELYPMLGQSLVNKNAEWKF